MKTIISLTVLFFVCFNCLGQRKVTLNEDDSTLLADRVVDFSTRYFEIIDTLPTVFKKGKGVIIKDTLIYSNGKWIKFMNVDIDTTMYELKRPTARYKGTFAPSKGTGPLKLTATTHLEIKDSGVIEYTGFKLITSSDFIKTDTTYCIMILCDTSLHVDKYGGFTIGTGEQTLKRDTTNRGYYEFGMKWSFGYRIVRSDENVGKYFDDRFTPFPEKYYVWMSKSLKK